MDIQSSHLAAALMGNSTGARNMEERSKTPATPEPVFQVREDASKDISETKEKMENEEEKEEILSGEEYTDEDAESGLKSHPGKGVTLQMLMEEKMLQPGIAAMTIEYLGQKFVGDLQADGKIKSHETETIFCSPSAWAIHCKRIINPDKRSGCGWASVKYKGKKLDTIKATYLRRKQLQRENMHSDEDAEMEAENVPEPPPQRIVMKHNTVPNRMMQHDANMLIEAVSFSSVGKIQPFLVSISTNAFLVLDLHCHLKTDEVHGYLAGSWDLNNHNVTITHTFPCLMSKKDKKPSVLIELEIQMEIEKLGLTLLGWYHSHPTNPAMPSLRDCDNQLDYQIKMRGPSEISYTPCLGVICSPYNPESPVLESSVTCFWVTPPPEQRPTEYPRPLLMQYTIIHDTHLSTHAIDQIKKSIKYYQNIEDDAFVKFKSNFKPDISYLDKLKCTLTPKFPKEQSDGLLWHFFRDELGCSSEQDDKLDLDALLAVPQAIPVSKQSQPVIPNIPSMSTLQQMVSRPAGIPPMNVSSSGLNSVSPHKFEMPTHLNIPIPQASKSSKNSNSSMPPAFPSGLDMLTSMALGLGPSSNMPLSMGGAGLDALAANRLLAGLSPSISTSLAASLSDSKMTDPPSYTASLQNLTSSIGNYDTPSSTSLSSSTASAIPASLASNLMMSSADIANALFSNSKFSSTGSLLGIPDPMSKSTLAANNMFLSPSLLKMQESLLKPLSSSSPVSSKSSLEQLMKSPQDILKSSKDYLPPDFSLGNHKSKLSISEKSSKYLDSNTSKDTSKSMETDIADYSMNSSRGSESFLSQMLELTKKTTLPDYSSDYSHSPLKLNKTDDYSSSVPHNFSSNLAISDTIAQVAMGNLPASQDNQDDYPMEQDLTMPKRQDTDE